MRADSRNNKRTNFFEGSGPSSAKKQDWSEKTEGPVATNPSVIPSRNHLAPLQMVEIDWVSTAVVGAQQPPTSIPQAVGRPPPIIVSQLVKIPRGIETPYEGYVRVPNNQKWQKDCYKRHGRLFCTNAPPRR